VRGGGGGRGAAVLLTPRRRAENRGRTSRINLLPPRPRAALPSCSSKGRRPAADSPISVITRTAFPPPPTPEKGPPPSDVSDPRTRYQLARPTARRCQYRGLERIAHHRGRRERNSGPYRSTTPPRNVMSLVRAKSPCSCRRGPPENCAEAVSCYSRWRDRDLRFSAESA